MNFSKLYNLCKQENITIAQLEEKMGFKKNWILKWQISEPWVNEINKVAEYFGVEKEYFFDRKK